MSYCSASDILTNLQMTEAEVPEALRTKAVTKADAKINSILPSEIVTAIESSTPEVIKSIAEDIGAYYVMRGLYSAENPNRTEWLNEYKDAIQSLIDIRDGKAEIDGITIEEQQILSSTEDYKSTFDTRDETTWGVDSDRIDDLEDEADD